MFDAITDVPGIRVGHATNADARTGCTVILCNPPAIASVDVRGGAPATHETDLLDPTCTVDVVHGVLLTGGSAFGLRAVAGVMDWLEERGIGYETGVARVPIVPAVALFDLAVGRSDVRPDATSGREACEAAQSGPVQQGRVGAGTGATTNKLGGPAMVQPGGIGTASIALPDGTVVGAIVAVNALGKVIGADETSGTSAITSPFTPPPGGNTTLAVIATTARLDKAQCRKVAQMAHDGMARSIVPIHTPFDGDTVFALALADRTAPLYDATRLALVGSAAADVLAIAVRRAVLA